MVSVVPQGSGTAPAQLSFAGGPAQATWFGGMETMNADAAQIERIIPDMPRILRQSEKWAIFCKAYCTVHRRGLWGQMTICGVRFPHPRALEDLPEEALGRGADARPGSLA